MQMSGNTKRSKSSINPLLIYAKLIKGGTARDNSQGTGESKSVMVCAGAPAV